MAPRTWHRSVDGALMRADELIEWVSRDRLEGKPQQLRDITISDKRDVREWTMEELDRRIAELTAAAEGGKAGRNGGPVSRHLADQGRDCGAAEIQRIAQIAPLAAECESEAPC
jgi:hypothetical protein